MRFACLPFLLLASMAMAQVAENVTPMQSVVATTATGSNTPTIPPAAKLDANTPVIVVTGVCDTPAKDTKSRAACKTVITRAQFDALADAIELNMDPIAKAQLAASYPRILAMQSEFRKRELENDSRVKLALEFAKMRTEADEAEKALKAKAADVSESEVQKYYSQNPGIFQEVELQRIYIPFSQNSNQATAARRGRPEPVRRADEGAKQADDPMKATAEAIRARAIAGEDFESLQADVFRISGMMATPPDANMGKRTADEMSQDRRPLVSMAVGEVSQVLNGPNGFYIYKVISKDIRPLDEVSAKIKSTVADLKFAELKERIEQSVKTQFNAAYFPRDPLAVPASVSSAKVNPGSTFGARSLASKGARTRSNLLPQYLQPAASSSPMAPPAGVVEASH